MVTFVSAFQSIVYVIVIIMALYGRHRNATIQGRVVIYSQNAA